MTDTKKNGRKRPVVNSNGKLKELAAKILDLYGRGDGKYVVLTFPILMKELGLDMAKVQWAIAPLIESARVASLTSRNSEAILLARNVSKNKNRFRYTAQELVTWLDPKYFDKVGEFLTGLLSGDDPVYLNDELLEEYDSEVGLPVEILDPAISCFVQAGLVKLGKKKRLTEGKKGRLDFDSLKSTFIAQRFTGNMIAPKDRTISSLADAARVYERYHANNLVKMIKLNLEKSEFSFKGMMEALIGNKDTDIEFIERELHLLEQMAKEKRPDVLVISGLVQGGFQHQEKNRRPTLAIKSDNQQFAVAKMILDRCLKLGLTKVIYNTGDDDQKLWEMHTVTSLMIMHYWQKGEAQSDSDKRSLNFGQVDKLKQDKAWDFHYWFQAHVVFEYMLRCGRRLYSAEEVAQRNGGRMMEEYLMLLDTYTVLVDLLKKQKDVTPEMLKAAVPDQFYNQVLQVEDIPLPGREFLDMVVTNDFNATVRLANGKTIRWWERHDFNLTPTAMKQDPVGKARSILGQLAASGIMKKKVVVNGQETVVDESPDVFAIEHQEQCFSVLDGKTLVVSHGSLREPHLDDDSTVSQVQKDKSRRVLTTRGELSSSSSQTITITGDGRYLMELHNNRLLDKMDISPERVAVVLYSDWQTGSVTARSDLQAMMMDYTFHEIMPKEKTVIIFDGDIIQGRNYPEMPNENVRMGLVRMHDQQEFVRRMIKASLKAAPIEVIRKNLERVGITPGNHEWNSFHKLTGDAYSQFLITTLQDFMEYNKIPAPVKYYDKVENNLGGHWNSWVMMEQVAGYGVLAQHYILEKGGKGGSGAKTNPARQLFSGTGDFFQDMDVMLTAHYHSPSIQIINGKIILVNGSWADASGYELLLGYRPMMGNLIVHLGGGLPPVVEIVTQKTLHAYKPKGFCSEENLAKLGFVTDKGFEPRHHGFARKTGQPQSAVQKWLWREVDDINWTMHTTLGPKKK